MEVQIIIGTDKEPIAKSLELCLIESGYHMLWHYHNGQDILRKMGTHKVDLVILEPSIKGIVLKEMAGVILRDYTTPVIVLANDAEAGYFYDMLEEVGFACIQKPLSKQALLQSIILLINTMTAIRNLKNKLNTLEKKLEDKTSIDTAKELLINERNMTEGEAHRYIQKESMDKKTSKNMIAKRILQGNL